MFAHLSFYPQGDRKYPLWDSSVLFLQLSEEDKMRGLFSIMVMIGGLYGIGVLSALEVTENVTNQLANKSFAEAGMLLATNFEAKQ